MTLALSCIPSTSQGAVDYSTAPPRKRILRRAGASSRRTLLNPGLRSTLPHTTRCWVSSLTGRRSFASCCGTWLTPASSPTKRHSHFRCACCWQRANWTPRPTSSRMHRVGGSRQSGACTRVCSTTSPLPAGWLPRLRSRWRCVRTVWCLERSSSSALLRCARALQPAPRWPTWLTRRGGRAADRRAPPVRFAPALPPEAGRHCRRQRRAGGWLAPPPRGWRCCSIRSWQSTTHSAALPLTG
mmetsp:Transcript_32794/g.105965  ORF Transcript_32794/g.105965 Transcript_32794/m.105965 type:complete len:242 (+) Transcript_32794:143-868(+)